MLEEPKKLEAAKLPRPRAAAAAPAPRDRPWFSTHGLNRIAAAAGRILQEPGRLAGIGAAGVRAAPNGRSPRAWRGFIVLVAAPVVAACVYSGFLASDQFVSEMRFAVRGTTQVLPGSDALGGFGAGPLIALNSNQDVYVVADYVGSRSMIDDLSKDIDLRAIYSKPGIDWWARFAPSKAPEELLRYWRDMVQTTVELASGIVTVKVTTFSRGDSVRLASAIRARCEIIADRLQDQVRRDAIARAKAEVETARARLTGWKASLERFRNARMQIDPMALARSLGDTSTTLRQDLIGVEVKLDAASASPGADAPQLKTLAANRQILADQIAALEARITSANLNLPAASAVLAEYDRLDVERSLAEQAVMLAEKQLDNARADANRHHIYLVSIEDPTVPESALGPGRLHMISIVTLSAISLWLLMVLIAANVRDHAI